MFVVWAGVRDQSALKDREEKQIAQQSTKGRFYMCLFMM